MLAVVLNFGTNPLRWGGTILHIILVKDTTNLIKTIIKVLFNSEKLPEKE